MRKRLPLPLLLLTALGLTATACSKTIPDEWKDVAGAENISSVVTSSEENIVVVYKDTDTTSVRADYRKTAEASGFTLAYECEYDDGRLSDGWIASPKSVQYTIMPDDEGDGIMVLGGRKNNTESFAAVPDTEFCTMKEAPGKEAPEK